jgi:hypothetical protein
VPLNLAPAWEGEVVERAARVFIDRLDRLVAQGFSLADARPVALVVALASIEDEPDFEHWAPLIEAALARRARAPRVMQLRH